MASSADDIRKALRARPRQPPRELTEAEMQMIAARLAYWTSCRLCGQLALPLALYCRLCARPVCLHCVSVDEAVAVTCRPCLRLQGV